MHLEEKNRNQLKETLRRQRQHIGYKNQRCFIVPRKEAKTLLPGVEYPVLRTAINTSLLTLWLIVQMPKGVHPYKVFLATSSYLLMDSHLASLYYWTHFIRIFLKKSTALESTWQQRWTRKQEVKWASSRPHHLTSLLWETAWIKTLKLLSLIWWQARNSKREPFLQWLGL